MTLTLRGTPQEIVAQVAQAHPEAVGLAQAADRLIPFIKRQIMPHEGPVLYHLAHQYNRPGARLLEIGTAWGYSACWLGFAVPEGQIVTLNPKEQEFARAVEHLQGLSNVTPLPLHSWDYLAQQQGEPDLDMVFVDGNHTAVGRDLPWFNRLKPGGLILFHDYSPVESKRPCVPVWQCLTDLAARTRPADVVVEDDKRRGMLGWYRQPGEQWEV